MIVLAIETSQRCGGVALRRADGTVDIESMASGRHNDDLMPAIDRVVRRAGLTPGDLGAIAVSIGPGGFTGLRIAVSTAKMLSFATGAEILAVPTAEVVVEGFVAGLAAEGSAVEETSVDGAVQGKESEESEESGNLLVALATKRESLWLARFERISGAWQPTAAGLAEGRTACLDGVALVLADDHQSPELCTRARKVVPAVYCPAACLRVGERYLKAGRIATAADFRPLYPREPEAVSLWARRNA